MYSIREREKVLKRTVVNNRSPVLGHLPLRSLALAAIPSRQLLAAPALRGVSSFAVVGALWSTRALSLGRSAAVGIAAGSELQRHWPTGAAWWAAVNGSHGAARASEGWVRGRGTWRRGLGLRLLVAGRVSSRSVAAAIVGCLLYRICGVCAWTAGRSGALVGVGRGVAV
jgi:hypothetical protein